MRFGYLHILCGGATRRDNLSFMGWQVMYHEAFVDGNRLCIVMEYAPHGDLSRAIRYGLLQICALRGECIILVPTILGCRMPSETAFIFGTIDRRVLLKRFEQPYKPRTGVMRDGEGFTRTRARLRKLNIIWADVCK